MSKRFAKVVSYLLVIALVMQDGLPTAAANNLTGRAERMTVLENDSSGVSDKEEADDKASNNQEALEENADKETPSEEQFEDKKTQEEEKQDDKASDNEEQSEDKTSEEEQSENKTSEEESAAENESSEDEQTTTEEPSETETETDIKTTETETEMNTTETETVTTEEETETAVEEKTVRADEETDEEDLFGDLYPGDEAVWGENLLPTGMFELEGENFKYWELFNNNITKKEVANEGKSVTFSFGTEDLNTNYQQGIKLNKPINGSILKLENGHTYVISYKIKSTSVRDVSSKFEGGENTEHLYSLKANQEKSIKYKITATGAWDNFIFYLGKVGDTETTIGEHEITISDFSIQEVIINLADGETPDESFFSDNLLENGAFTDGSLENWNTDKRANANIKTANNKVVFDFNGTDEDDWTTWLQQNFEWSSGTKYKIEFDAYSTCARYIRVASDSGGGKRLQRKLLNVGENHVVYELTDMTGGNFTIMLGSNLQAGQDYKNWDGTLVKGEEEYKQDLPEHRVMISNVKITELPVELPDTPNDTAPAEITNLHGYDGIIPSYLAPLKDGKFLQSVEVTSGTTQVTSPENAKWKLWHEAWMTEKGVECIPVPDGMAFKMNTVTGTDDIGNHPWDAQFNQKISLKKDLQYTLSFTVKSEKARSINISIDDIGGADENGNGTPWVKPIAIQKNETREVVLNLPKLTADALDKTFMIQMGHIAGTPDGGNNTLTFTNMKLEVNGYSKLAERISDGYFNDGDPGNFKAETNNKAKVLFKDEYIHADITEDCANRDVAVSSGKFDLLGNDDDYDYQYEVRFIAGATKDRTIKVMLVNSIGTTLKEESFNLTTDAKKYSFIYKPKPDQKNVSLKLMLGGSKGTVCVDTVRCDLKGYPEAAGLDTDGHDITVLEKKSIPVISEMPADEAVAGNDIVISFDKEGNDTYKDSINEILINGIKVSGDNFQIGERTGESGRNDEYTITLDNSLFNVEENAEEGRQVFTIEVRAPWYLNNKLHQTVYTKKKWNDTWLEEFDGTQLDMTKWSYQTGRGDNNDGWGNRE